ncbi:hypothetical protein P9112_005775 [Eukaryota sp. TZLM1-RC]
MSELNVGILAHEIYFPNLFVSQTDLEQYHNISPGKLTKGLGQLEMGFTGDREDVNSISLSVVSKLLSTHSISPSQIGRISVGTESTVDKSKSVKSVLMRLFKDSNTDIEGCDVTNACYGATQALFDSIAWVESSSYDGRYALVVAADIAVYEEGPARPTGGAGAVALLIGRNAPLVFSTVRASYSFDAHDFYKPILGSEYPLVNGQSSINSYLTAVTECYSNYKTKFSRLYGKELNYNCFSHLLFHAPFHKMVFKAFSQLYSEDFDDVAGQNDDGIPVLFERKVEPGQLLCKRVGNMYCASLYGSLISLMSNDNVNFSKGDQILLFSYGSGLCSTVFSLFVADDSRLDRLSLNLNERLSQRLAKTPQEFQELLSFRENLLQELENSKDFKGFKPSQSIDDVLCGSYYLDFIDEYRIRHYSFKE